MRQYFGLIPKTTQQNLALFRHRVGKVIGVEFWAVRKLQIKFIRHR